MKKLGILCINLLAMALVAVILVIVTKKGLEKYTHHGEEITVPDVVGKSLATARLILEAQGLESELTDSSYNRSLAPGTIVIQKPQAGSHVKAGRVIGLVINSRSTPTMVVPDIAGNSSLREAEERLTQLGFELGPREYVPGDAEWVYGITCNGRQLYGGEKVPIGSVICIQVGGHDPNDTLFNEDEIDMDGVIEVDEGYTDDAEADIIEEVRAPLK